jgi:alpha-beta hydrolase superfamily lysophospholipase
MNDLPPLRRYLAELPGTLARFRVRPDRTAARGRDGKGRAVLVIPGFLAGDRFTLALRNTLDAAGYCAFGWGAGLNRGATPDLFEKLEARLDAVIDCAGAPVSLVGWSLGGIYARELAKRHPGVVDRVITLGSPISGDPRANRAWRIYERVAGHPVDAPPIAVRVGEKPPVPTFAIWSRNDGIVAPSAARGQPGERDAEIEVTARHVGMIWQRSALIALLDALEAHVLPTGRCQRS